MAAAVAAELAAIKNGLLRTLRSGVSSKIVMVLGNESCDLDSACSSIVFALFTLQKSEYQGRIVAPVLNVKRQQFLSRTEVVFWLNRVLFIGANNPSGGQQDLHKLLDTFIFFDEIDFDKIDCTQLKVKLVDHNCLTDQQQFLAPCVDEIVDHHEVNSAQEEWSSNVQTEIVHPVGSCATLLTRRLKEEWPSLPPSVAHLLYGAIVMDTGGLRNANKTTELDRNAVAYLESKFAITNGWPSRTDTDEMLIAAKKDVSCLSASDILSKDFKNVPRSQPSIGMSTAPMSVEELGVKVASEPNCFERFCEENSLAGLVVLTFASDTHAFDNTQKLVIYSPHQDVYLTILRALGGESDVDLQLKLFCNKNIATPASTTTKIYSVNSGFVSRKKLLPMIERYFSS